MSNLSVIPGSIGAIAKQSGKSLAESFLSCEVIILVDTSGSMTQNDARNGKSRYEQAQAELTNLQNKLPGKVAVISFNSDVQFSPSGIPSPATGSTAMEKALQFVLIADKIPGMRFFLISDGDPNDERETLKIARMFHNKIDTVFVGPEGGSGQDFLQRLAKATGGQSVTAAKAAELQAKIEVLLLKA